LSINTSGHRVGNVYSFRLAITDSDICAAHFGGLDGVLSLLRQRRLFDRAVIERRANATPKLAHAIRCACEFRCGRDALW